MMQNIKRQKKAKKAKKAKRLKPTTNTRRPAVIQSRAKRLLSRQRPLCPVPSLYLARVDVRIRRKIRCTFRCWSAWSFKKKRAVAPRQLLRSNAEKGTTSGGHFRTYALDNMVGKNQLDKGKYIQNSEDTGASKKLGFVVLYGTCGSLLLKATREILLFLSVSEEKTRVWSVTTLKKERDSKGYPL